MPCCGARTMNTRPHALRRRRGAPRRSAARGVVLIEALVGIMIFTIGVLGLVGLQAAMIKTNTQASYRAEAAQLAEELVNRMWLDTGNLASYADNSRCKALPACNQWLTRVAARMPGGVEPSIVTGADGRTDIVITWITPGETAADARHTFRTGTAVSPQPSAT